MVKQEVVREQSASMEDYLETIYILSEKDHPVKVTEISKALGVKKPSVTAALVKLSKAGLVQHEKYGNVVLTTKGVKIGKDVYKRHTILRRFLVEILDIIPSVAEVDACQIEHVISQTTMDRLTEFLEFVISCPQGEAKWLKCLKYYFKHGKRNEEFMNRCIRD